jgi:hypothetical protein
LWLSDQDRAAYGAKQHMDGGGGLAGRLAGDCQQGLLATKRDGKITEMKRRPREIHLGARKGGRSAGGADRDEGRAPAVAL